LDDGTRIDNDVEWLLDTEGQKIRKIDQEFLNNLTNLDQFRNLKPVMNEWKLPQAQDGIDGQNGNN
jgi:hypothetical protein